MATITDTLYLRAMASEKAMRMKAVDVANAVAHAVTSNPDALRAVLGSVGFRDAEIYASIKDRAEADFEEWAHV